MYIMCGSRTFFQRESKFDDYFLVDKVIDDTNTAINGPASETPLKWRFAGGPLMAQH